MSQTLEQKYETFKERYHSEHPSGTNMALPVPSLSAFEAGYYRKEEERDQGDPDDSYRASATRLNALKYAIEAAREFDFDGDLTVTEGVLTFAREFEAYLNGAPAPPASQPNGGAA